MAKWQILLWFTLRVYQTSEEKVSISLSFLPAAVLHPDVRQNSKPSFLSETRCTIKENNLFLSFSVFFFQQRCAMCSASDQE